ncbi:MAG: hypothetical protein COB98_01460 [Flavobacteriaceae bacterium]|nr:MAG: hypothetical protein COB98_01460 [Flavobacteriaceae bacterium]
MKKIILIAAFMAGVFCVNAQSELNGYKFVIVKKQYGFQKSPDKYQLNSLAKFLLAKSDLIVLFDTDAFSEEVAMNACLALKVDIIDTSGMFSTQLAVSFKDCKNNVVYTTVIGRSKAKEYKKAYHEALRASLAVFKSYIHTYKGKPLRSVVEKTPEITAVAYTGIDQENLKSVPVGFTTLLGLYANKDMSFDVKVSGDDYVFVHPEIGKIADVYKTFKSTVFIVQWAGENQARLMEIGADGSLKIDAVNGVKIYKKQ